MTEKSNKILILTTAYKPLIGGSEIAIESIAKNLPQTFFDIVTPRHAPQLSSIENDGNARIYRTGMGNAFDKYLFIFSGFWMAQGLMKRESYLAVHAYQASFGGLVGALLKSFHPSITFILTLQEGKNLERQNFFVRRLRAFIIKKADRITAISNYLADYARRYNTKASIDMIPNGVDLGLFNPESVSVEAKQNLKTNLGIIEGEKVIVTTSRLVAKNGISSIIEASDGIISRIPGIKILIVGAGHLENQLKDQALHTNSRDKIIFTGAIDHTVLPLYLAISDLFVRPSESEGLGSSFLEAMAMNVPVLGTPVGGIPDFIKELETGFLWNWDKETLAQRIIEILENEALARQVAEKGRALVLERYGWSTIALNMKFIYDQTI